MNDVHDTYVPFVISCPHCGQPHQTSQEMSACVTACKHPQFIKIINPEDGGVDSTIYKCEECNDLFVLSIAPMKIDVVSLEYKARFDSLSEADKNEFMKFGTPPKSLE